MDSNFGAKGDEFIKKGDKAMKGNGIFIHSFKN